MKLATLCYIKHEGKTLMIQRVKRKEDMHYGKWNGLGGKLDLGESPEDCARREILEESGLTVGELELKGVLTFPAFSKNEDWYAFVFIGRNPIGELLEPPEGYLAWISDDELLDLDLWEGDRIFIPWLDRLKIFSGKFTYHDGILEGYEASFYPA